jgi:hypothetical protein
MSRKHFPAAVPVSIGCSVGLQGRATGLQSPHDVLQVTDAPGQPINLCDHENVTRAEKIEQE